MLDRMMGLGGRYLPQGQRHQVELAPQLWECPLLANKREIPSLSDEPLHPTPLAVEAEHPSTPSHPENP